MLDLLDPTPHQALVINELLTGDKRAVCWLGATGSGKTAGLCESIALMSQRDTELGIGGGDSILLGQTVGQLKRNLGGYLQDVCKQLRIPFHAGNDDGAYYRIAGQKWHLFSGGKDGDAARVQGLDALHVWNDESSLVWEDAFQASTLRMRYPQGRLIMSTNAGNPFHFIKQTFIDHPPEWCLPVETPFEQNHHFDETQRDWLSDSFISGHIRARMLGNIWAAAGGLVYPFDMSHTVDEPFDPAGVVAADAGTAGVTAATLFTHRGDGLMIADEYYHEAEKEGVLTDVQHIERILIMWSPQYWVVDPAAASFIAALRKMNQTVRRAKNDILTGVQTVLKAIFSGLGVINRRCKRLLSETAGIVWNPLTDLPKEGVADHAADTMRYGFMELAPLRASLALGGR